MFVIAPETCSNPGLLQMSQMPRRFLGRVMVWPRRDGGGWRLRLRLIFEVEILRYLSALAPFVVAALVWPNQSLAIAQAPLPMLMVIYFVEMRFLRLTPAARARLMSEADRDRALDLLAVRGRRILAQIAARRRMMQGALHLVIEQSDMARVAPLTLVTVQWTEGPEVLDLSRAERDLIRAQLFDDAFSERQMHRLSLARGEPLHEVVVEVRHIPAHSRMAALTL